MSVKRRHEYVRLEKITLSSKEKMNYVLDMWLVYNVFSSDLKEELDYKDAVPIQFKENPTMQLEEVER
jgi:hypothetical protein